MAASPQQDGIRVRRQPGERAAIAFFEHDPADVPVRVARADDGALFSDEDITINVTP